MAHATPDGRLCRTRIFIISDRIPNYPGLDIFAIIKKTISYLSAISGCLCVYIISYKTSKTAILKNSLIKMVRYNTFGLYLYSETLNYVILSIATVIFGNIVFVTNMGAAGLCFARIGITFIVALVISVILHKLKFKYLC